MTNDEFDVYVIVSLKGFFFFFDNQFAFVGGFEKFERRYKRR